ncbi:MAG: DUF932 domain-containing protein [Desulfobacteraceae bacterium]
MPFACEPIVEKEFFGIEQLLKWVDREEANLARVPMADFIKSGARFLDDEYLGDSSALLRFNDKGIRSFCSVLGLRYDTLNLIERPSLVCEVLNDLINQREIQARLAGLDLVLDEISNVIIGIVSHSYVSYGNKEFLRDILHLLNLDQTSSSPGQKTDRFSFQSGFSINTQMVLRFFSRLETGKIKGVGGEGKDRSEVGIQFKNSMVGDSAVSLDYFIHRLVCANGLVAPAGRSVNRVIHSGKRDTFLERLQKCFGEVERTIGRAGERIETLRNIPFDPGALAKAELSERIFDIIPGSRSTILEKKGIKKVPNTKLTQAEKINREADIIVSIPDFYGGKYSRPVFQSRYRDGVTLFDFINVFTEYAKTQSLQKRLEIEEKSGALADWLVNNKKKLVR